MNKPSVSCMYFAILLAILSLSPCPAAADAAGGGSRAAWLEIVDSGTERKYEQVSAGFWYLVGDQMKDSYEYMPGVYGYIGGWQIVGRGNIGRMGARLEAGGFGADGSAIPTTTDWTIDTSDISMFAFPLNLTFLYRLKDTDDQTFFVPFVGIGLGGMFGLEKLTADVTPPGGIANFEWGHTDFRASFTAHALVGFNIWESRKYKGNLEIRWTQSGKSGYSNHGEITQEMKDDGWSEEVFAVLAKPDFDFTGPSVSVGVSW